MDISWFSSVQASAFELKFIVFVIAEHLSENTVEASLTYKGLTNSYTLPKLAIENDEYCDLISNDGPLRPTHVVSEIVHGMNAYLQFTTTSR